MTVLFNLVGGSIGPAIAGIYMQTHQAIVKGVAGSFPSPDSYNLIFLSLTLASLVPLALAVFIRQRQAANQVEKLQKKGKKSRVSERPDNDK
jgi:hypothetical protein